MVVNPAQSVTTFVRLEGGINLAYETIGERSRPPIVLIAGLGAQLVNWPRDFCECLAERGYCVVRFDNRDAGLSTKASAVYSLSDMADDVSGLIRTLGFAAAHVVGQSLGGLIAQALVLRHPEQVLSLALLSSTPSLAHFEPVGAAVMSTPRPAAVDREEAIEQFLAREAFFSAPFYPADLQSGRGLAGAMWDRGWSPEGTGRQLVALLGAGDMTGSLRSLRVPTLIIHGDADPLINASASRAMAAAIPGAELRVVSGLGHQLPAALWPDIVGWISANAEKQAQQTSDTVAPMGPPLGTSPPRTRTISWEDPSAGLRFAEGLTGLEYLRGIFEGRFPAPPITATMSFTGVEVGDGTAVFHGEPGEFLYNPIGVVHGGFAMTLLDSALGCAIHTTLGVGERYPTLETKVNFVRPITTHTGRVRCQAKVVYRGGKIATAECQLTAELSGKLLAHGTATCLILTPGG